MAGAPVTQNLGPRWGPSGGLLELLLARKLRRINETAADRLLARRFVIVVAAEIVAFASLNPIFAATGHVSMLPSLNLTIVGVHFLPLAWLFRVPRYYVMGLLFCVIPMSTLWWVPAQASVGSAIGCHVIPTLGCSAVAVLTGAAGLREARLCVGPSLAGN
jgi:hypothetical protein